jgi:hypothetical protein
MFGERRRVHASPQKRMLINQRLYREEKSMPGINIEQTGVLPAKVLNESS